MFRRQIGPTLFLLLGFTAFPLWATEVAVTTKTVKACDFALNPTLAIIKRVPHPSNWKVVIVCTDMEWDRLLMLDKRIEHISNYAFTRFSPNDPTIRPVTYIRGHLFVENPPFNYRPERVLKHELGHIFCKCMNEDTASNWADQH